MSMAEFINENLESVLTDWEDFATRLLPGRDLTALRDHAHEILLAIAEDMATTQSEAARAQKGRGDRPENAPLITESARYHATERLSHGLTLNEMVAEYRALRASVVGRWTAEFSNAGMAELRELTRFNEGIDQSLTEAIALFDAQLGEARDLFIGSLAHDMRTPLSAIATSAEALLRAKDPSQLPKAARIIQRSASRMQQMIADLLDFTRVRFGLPLHTEPAETDVGKLCRSVIDELSTFNPGVKLNLDIAGELSGKWDPARIQQLLANLIGNAIQYGAPYGPIDISIRAETEDIRIAIHNNGPALPPDVQRAIFDPFIRHDDETATGTHSGGLGLGLYIARQTAEAHGGTIEITSSAEYGTMFTVTLPREAPWQNGLSGAAG